MKYLDMMGNKYESRAVAACFDLIDTIGFVLTFTGVGFILTSVKLKPDYIVADGDKEECNNEIS